VIISDRRTLLIALLSNVLALAELRRCFLKKKKALDYDSRGLWLNGVAVESGERCYQRTIDDLAAIRLVLS
jgi:hypothetical protein